jgi:hypothetical protein
MLRLALVVAIAGIAIGLLLRAMLDVIYQIGITPLAVALGFLAVGILQIATIWFWHDTKRFFSSQ